MNEATSKAAAEARLGRLMQLTGVVLILIGLVLGVLSRRYAFLLVGLVGVLDVLVGMYFARRSGGAAS